MEAQIFENYIKKIFSEKISWACVLTATLHMVLPFQGRRLCSLAPHLFLNSKQSQSAVRELHERCSSLTRVSRLLCTKVNASTHTDKFVYRLVLGSVSSCSVCFGIPRVLETVKQEQSFQLAWLAFPYVILFIISTFFFLSFLFLQLFICNIRIYTDNMLWLLTFLLFYLLTFCVLPLLLPSWMNAHLICG